MSLAPGTRVTQSIELVRPLGAGGMGAVWLADHSGLKTQVVVKFMLNELGESASARMRFSREAAAAAQVKSPHVVQMLDHGLTDANVPFIVMEHLEGKSLGEHMDQKGILTPRETVLIVTQVAKALSRVHGASLLHRDIKPDNIFLCDGDGDDEVFVKLLDFGIVKSHDSLPSLDGDTKTGQIVGTPFYMSPEQVKAEKTIDSRSDLWALGVVTFEMLTARRPFEGPSFGALAVAIATGEPLKASELVPSLPKTLDAFFERALARDPAHRFSTAKEFAEALRFAFGATTSLPPSGDSSPRSWDAVSSRKPVDSAAKTERVATPIELDSTAVQGSMTSAPSTSSALSRSQPAVQSSNAGPDLGMPGARGSGRLVKTGIVLGLGVAAFFIVRLFSGHGSRDATPVATAQTQATLSPSTPLPMASVPTPTTSATSPRVDPLPSATAPVAPQIAKTAPVHRPGGEPAGAKSSAAAITPPPTASTPTPAPKSSGDILF